MSIAVAGKVKQMNGGTYKLMDLADIDNGDGTSAKDLVDGHTTAIAELTTLVNSANADVDGGNFTDVAGADVINGGDF